MKHKLENSANILVLLVTCARTKQRQIIEKSVIEQLVKIVKKELPNLSFMLFDNNSKYSNHLDKFQEIGPVFSTKNNRGLWSAIHWVLRNESRIYTNPHKYLHIIESDLFVKTLVPLIEISNTLDKFVNLHMARTQEFSVRYSWRFNKKYSFLPYPFHIRRSQVDLKNTSNLLDFRYKLIANLSNYNLYSTNLNEKTSDIIAMLDKGIWYSLTDSKKYSKDTGSYGDPLYLSEIGYQETRYSLISIYKEMEVTLYG